MGKGLVNLAKTFRKGQTDAENLLWRHLRGKQLEGFKFRRQQFIGNYIVDFVCLEKSLILEIDGGQHAVGQDRDIDRDNWLMHEGFKILRFWNNEVLQNVEGVLEVIRDNCLNKQEQ